MYKTANVLNKLPKSLHSKAKRALQEIWMAETKKDAVTALDAFAESYGTKYDKAVDCLTKDRDTLLAFYRLPLEALANDEPDRKHFRDRAASDDPFERLPFEQNCTCDGVQAGQGRPEKLASARWS